MRSSSCGRAQQRKLGACVSDRMRMQVRKRLGVSICIRHFCSSSPRQFMLRAPKTECACKCGHGCVYTCAEHSYGRRSQLGTRRRKAGGPLARV
eukprot:5096048-Pleurochrysis_carterae.AAC.3